MKFDFTKVHTAIQADIKGIFEKYTALHPKEGESIAIMLMAAATTEAADKFGKANILEALNELASKIDR